jgi:hypothetical protein
MKRFVLTGFAMLFLGFAANAQEFRWYTYTDNNDRGTSTIAMAETAEKISGRDTIVRTFSGRVTTNYVYGYAGVSLIPADEETLQRLKKAKGIIVSVSGGVSNYRLSVVTSLVTDYNDYGMTLTTSEKTADITINFSSPPLSQEPWGKRVVFDKSKITGLKIQTIGQPIASFRFKITGIRFIE